MVLERFAKPSVNFDLEVRIFPSAFVSIDTNVKYKELMRKLYKHARHTSLDNVQDTPLLG